MTTAFHAPRRRDRPAHRGHPRGPHPGRATGTTSCTRSRPSPPSASVVNLGPVHPATHGVLRLILELDGEKVRETRVDTGYLHTGIEKNMEYRTWTQGVAYCTRMDSSPPFFQEAAYCLGVEKLPRASKRTSPSAPPSSVSS